MYKSTTKVKTDSAGNRVMDFCISERMFCLFTLNHRHLIITENTKKYPILLLNRIYKNQDSLNSDFDKYIIIATKANDADDFISNMDTYIDLYNSISNETTEEIIHAAKIISEKE